MMRIATFNIENLDNVMTSLIEEYAEPSASQEMLREAAQRLRSTKVEDIFDEGLHEFLTRFVAETRKIASAIAADYRFVE